MENNNDEICTFCNHKKSEHSGRATWGRTSCTVQDCVCAVYSSPESHKRNEQFERDLVKVVSVTAAEVADRIHATHYGKGEKHSGAQSCPCRHLAMFYLGLSDETGLYWPDSKGGNVWKT